VNKNTKGALFTVESFVAAMIILTATFVLYTGSSITTEDQIKPRLDGCLHSLIISSRIYDRNELESEGPFEEEIDQCLPPGVGYKTVVCGNTCGNLTLPEDRSVSRSGYIIGGVGDYPKKIIVYGWVE